MRLKVPASALTGRSIVVFHRHRASEAFEAMSARLGVRRTNMATARDFVTAAPRVEGEGLVFDRLGVAIIKRAPSEVETLPASPSNAIVVTRPEYVLRIPRYRVAPAYLEDEAVSMDATGGAGPAWSLETTRVTRSSATGKGIRVAVLDSGFSPHPDVRTAGPASLASFVPGDSSTADPIGHGTHCAGVIAGALRPAQGSRYGVAPGVSLFAGRVVDGDGRAPEAVVVAGINWALKAACRIISLSLGVPTASRSGPDPVYEKIAAVAAEQNCFLIAAAGNESALSIDQPAASTSIMGVTASTRAGVIAIWANRGEPDGRAAINLTAPGVGIRSAWNDGGYRVLDGTSCATPFVAGVAALYCELFPTQQAPEIWQHMCRSALVLKNPINQVPLPPTAEGAGLVQAPS